MFFKKKTPTAKAAPAAAKPAAAAPAAAPAKPAGDGKAAAAAPAKKGGFKLPFGKKKATAAAAAPAKPAGDAKPPAAAAPKPAGDAKPAAKPAAKAKGGSPLKLILPIVAILALAGGAYFAYTKVIAPSSPASDAAALANVSAADADNAQSIQKKPKAAAQNAAAAAESDGACPGKPKFAARLGLGDNVYFDTFESHRLVLMAPVPNSDAVSKYASQSWIQPGLVDAFTLDRAGNVYVAATPRLGPGVKTAKAQNIIYRVDTNTGNLDEFVTLSDAAAPSPENPFGILGMAYDCDTNSLYVSSVAGSTTAQEAGHIYRIDVNLGVVAGRVDNIDAMGLAIGNGANGKQLLFGSARAPKIRAVTIAADGNLQNDAHDVGALAEAQRAALLKFASPTELVVQAVEFNLANAETPQGTEIRFTFDPASGNLNPGQ